MKHSMIVLLSTVILMAGADASTITFPGPNSSGSFTENGATFTITGDGYMWNTDYHSASYCALCNTSYGSIIVTKTSGTAMTVSSLWMKGGWSGFLVTIKGYNGDSLKYTSSSVSLSASYAQTTLSGWSGITKISITGVNNGTFYVDDISYTETAYAPTNITLSNNLLTPGVTSGKTVGTFSVTDQNSGDTQTLSLVSGTGSTDNAKFRVSGDTLYTAATLSAGLYSIRVNTNDGTYNYAKAFSIIADLSYASDAGTYQDYDYITNVTFNTINNTSDGSTGGYTFYSNDSTTIKKLGTYTLSVTNTPSSVMYAGYPENIKAWIDWNHDGSLDSTEAYSVGKNLTTQKTSSVSVMVPSSATIGMTRLRVALRSESTATDPASTGSFDYGEVEDYVVFVAAAVTNVSGTGATVPSVLALHQNYPNPFNPSTTIRYDLPKQSVVTLKVYDILGHEVATLVNETKAAGSYTTVFNAAHCPSGVYFYKLIAGNYSVVKKLLLLK